MPFVRSGEAPLYHGTFDCAKKTLARDGILGFYKGMGAPVMGVAPIFAICFYGYNWGKRIFGEDPMHLR